MNKLQAERRSQIQSMSDEQFRNFVAARFDEGSKQFDVINSGLEDLKSHIKNVSVSLSENTEVTRNTASLAEKTAAGTAELVAISNFAKSSANAVKAGTRGASRTARVLIPIVVLGAIASAWWHGEPIHIKEILEAIK